jgi:hypothetical protein
VVSYINPKNTIRQIAAAAKMNDLEIRRIVYGLLQAGLVEIIRPEGAPPPASASTSAPPANKEEQKSLDQPADQPHPFFVIRVYRAAPQEIEESTLCKRSKWWSLVHSMLEKPSSSVRLVKSMLSPQNERSPPKRNGSKTQQRLPWILAASRWMMTWCSTYLAHRAETFRFHVGNPFGRHAGLYCHGRQHPPRNFPRGAQHS